MSPARLNCPSGQTPFAHRPIASTRDLADVKIGSEMFPLIAQHPHDCAFTPNGVQAWVG